MTYKSRVRGTAGGDTSARDFSSIGWWGVALVACGLTVLFFALTSFSPD